MAASWECPSLPMLSLPMKETSKNSFLSLKVWIGTHYEENPDSFEEEIKQLDQLREAVVKTTRDSNGMNVMRRYFAQLHLVKARFPVQTCGQIPIDFAWKDVYTGTEYVQEGINIEQACVLYNIAALHSQLGSNFRRSTEQEMKEACTHFQCAAGAIAYLEEYLGMNGCKDLAPEFLTLYKNLMLGQAQECLVEKSLKGTGKVKNNTIAKLSAKVADYYMLALRTVESEPCSIISKKQKDWIKLLKAKQAYYQSIACLFQGQSCAEMGKHGEKIAYYQMALQKVTSAGKAAKGTGDVAQEAVTNLIAHIGEIHQAAVKENDQVYHERVPGADDLPPIVGSDIVKPLAFQPVDSKQAGTDILGRLVPMKAYEAASVYSEEKATLLRSLMSSVEVKDEELRQYVSSLNLEEVEALDKEPQLPDEVLQQHNLLESKVDVIRKLHSDMEELLALSEKVSEDLSLVAKKRQEEEQEEQDFQAKFGPRAMPQECVAVWKECENYQNFHQQAMKSNRELKAMLDAHYKNLLVLAGPLSGLSTIIPKASLLDTPPDEGVSQRWEELMAKIEQMKQQRLTLMTQLKEQMNKEDITKTLIGHVGQNMEGFIDEHMKKHRDCAEVIRLNLAAQERILAAVTEANAGMVKKRLAAQELVKRQKDVYNSLVASANALQLLQNKIREGLGFYTRLHDNTQKLVKKANDLCSTRKKERQGLDRTSPSPSEPSVAEVPKLPSTEVLKPPSSGSQPVQGQLPPARPPKKSELRGTPLQQGSVEQSNQPEKFASPSQVVTGSPPVSAVAATPTVPTSLFPLVSKVSAPPVLPEGVDPRIAELQKTLLMQQEQLLEVQGTNHFSTALPQLTKQGIAQSDDSQQPSITRSDLPSSNVREPSSGMIGVTPPSATPGRSSVSPPSMGTSALPPSMGTSALPPSMGTSALPPSMGTSALPPSMGTSALPPSMGTLTLPPSMGTSTLPSSMGTLTLPPSLGTSVLPPSLGTSALSPSMVVSGIPPSVGTLGMLFSLPPLGTTGMPPPDTSGMPLTSLGVPPLLGMPPTQGIPPASETLGNLPTSGTLGNLPTLGTLEMPHTVGLSGIQSTIWTMGVPSSLEPSSEGHSSQLSNVTPERLYKPLHLHPGQFSSIGPEAEPTDETRLPRPLDPEQGSSRQTVHSSNTAAEFQDESRLLVENGGSNVGGDGRGNDDGGGGGDGSGGDDRGDGSGGGEVNRYSEGGGKVNRYSEGVGGFSATGTYDALASQFSHSEQHPAIQGMQQLEVPSTALVEPKPASHSPIPSIQPTLELVKMQPSEDLKLLPREMAGISSGIVPLATSPFTPLMTSTVESKPITTTGPAQPSAFNPLWKSSLDTLDVFSQAQGPAVSSRSSPSLMLDVGIRPTAVSTASSTLQTAPGFVRPSVSRDHTPPPADAQSSHIVQLEVLTAKQQETIRYQSKQLDDQRQQIAEQKVTIESLQRHIAQLQQQLVQMAAQQQLQEKEKVTTTSQQAALLQLLQQQQGLFSHQQAQVELLSQEREAQRKELLEAELRHKQALAQEGQAKQALDGQLSQKNLELQRLQQQQQVIVQQLQVAQVQMGQYHTQIQERDKQLVAFREQHKEIVQGLEQRHQTKVSQLTQQIQELQAELMRANEQVGPMSHMLHPSGPQPQLLQRQQSTPAPQQSQPQTGTALSSGFQQPLWQQQPSGHIMDRPTPPMTPLASETMLTMQRGSQMPQLASRTLLTGVNPPHVLTAPMTVQGPQQPMQGLQPMQGPQQPMQGPQQPMQGPQRPMQGPQQPMQGPQQPMQGPQQSMQGPQQPMQGPQQSMQGPQQPMQGPQQPMQGPQRPMQGPQQPMQGPQQPMQGPQQSMQGPQQSMQGPQQPMQGLQQSMQRPQQPMQGLQQSMQGPQQPMQGPQQSMQGPQQPMQGLQPMQGPQQPMQGPQQPMQGPQQSMQGPQQSMQGPQQPMQGLQPMQGPQQPMQGPQQPMQGPQQPMQGLQQSMQRPQQPMQGPQQSMQGLQQPMPGLQQPMPGSQQSMQRPQQPMQYVMGSPMLSPQMMQMRPQVPSGQLPMSSPVPMPGGAQPQIPPAGSGR